MFEAKSKLLEPGVLERPGLSDFQVSYISLSIFSSSIITVSHDRWADQKSDMVVEISRECEFNPSTLFDVSIVSYFRFQQIRIKIV